jgi:hypothetical protein
MLRVGMHRCSQQVPYIFVCTAVQRLLNQVPINNIISLCTRTCAFVCVCLGTRVCVAPCSTLVDGRPSASARRRRRPVFPLRLIDHVHRPWGSCARPVDPRVFRGRSEGICKGPYIPRKPCQQITAKCVLLSCFFGSTRPLSGTKLFAVQIMVLWRYVEKRRNHHKNLYLVLTKITNVSVKETRVRKPCQQNIVCTFVFFFKPVLLLSTGSFARTNHAALEPTKIAYVSGKGTRVTQV